MNSSQSDHSTDHHSSDGWEPCPAGVIQSVADRQQRQRQKAAMGRRAMIGAAVLLVAATAALLFSDGGGDRTMIVGRISCATVHDRAARYVSKELEDHEMHEVKKHCDSCKSCREYIAALQTASSHASSQPDSDDIVVVMAELP